VIESCEYLFQIAWDCEMSNQATLLLEVIVAIGVGGLIGSLFYLKEQDRQSFDLMKKFVT